MADWMEPFALTIAAAKKYVVSSTLEQVDWNAELVRGDNLENAVRQLKRQPGKGLFVGGVKLPLALAEGFVTAAIVAFLARVEPGAMRPLAS